MRLLIEFLSEDMPTQCLHNASTSWGDFLHNKLIDASIQCEFDTHYTKRRFVFDGKLNIPNELRQAIKGPSLNANEIAINGFINKHNIGRDKLIEIDFQSGRHLGYYKLDVIRDKQEYLCSILSLAFSELKTKSFWNEAMIWPNSPIKWIRPIVNVLCIQDDMPLKIKLHNDIYSTDLTEIERDWKNVRSVEDYFAITKRHINLDFASRFDSVKKVLSSFEIPDSFFSKTKYSDFFETIRGIKCSFLSLMPEVFVSECIKDLLGIKIPNQSAFVVFCHSDADETAIKNGYESAAKNKLFDMNFYYQDLLQTEKSVLKNLLLDGDFFFEVESWSQRLTRLKEVFQNSWKWCWGVDLGKYGTSIIEEVNIAYGSKLVAEYPSLLYDASAEFWNHNQHHLFSVDGEKAADRIMLYKNAINGLKSELSEDINKIILPIVVCDVVDQMAAGFFAGLGPDAYGDPYGMKKLADRVIKILEIEQLNLCPISLARALIRSRSPSAKQYNDVLRSLIDLMNIRLDLLIRGDDSSSGFVIDLKRIRASKRIGKFLAHKPDLVDKIRFAMKRISGITIIKNDPVFISKKNIDKNCKEEVALFEAFREFKKALWQSRSEEESTLSNLAYSVENIASKINLFMNNVRIMDGDIETKERRILMLSSIYFWVSRVVH